MDDSACPSRSDLSHWRHLRLSTEDSPLFDLLDLVSKCSVVNKAIAIESAHWHTRDRPTACSCEHSICAPRYEVQGRRVGHLDQFTIGRDTEIKEVNKAGRYHTPPFEATSSYFFGTYGKRSDCLMVTCTFVAAEFEKCWAPDCCREISSDTSDVIGTWAI